MTKQRHTTLLLLFLWLCALGLHPAVVAAQDSSASSPSIAQTPTGVAVTWTNRQARDGATPSWQEWPRVSVHGVDLPAQLITVALGDVQAAEIEITALASRAWTGKTLPYAATQLPTRTLITGEVYPPLAAPVERVDLPDSPVVLLREGINRGQRFAVLALTPLYAKDGTVHEVSRLSFDVADATMVSAGVATDREGGWRLVEDVVGPSPLAQQAALKVTVHTAGLQEIKISEVIAAGLIGASEVDRLQLHLDGEQVALEVDAAADRLRFYAPAVGDRWNRGSVYWLLRGESSGLRMQQRAASTAAGDSLPLRATGWETGSWSAPTLYVSQAAGPDGDFWFMADLRSGPDLPTSVVTLTTALGLPSLNASATMTLTGDAYVGATHTLDLVTVGVGGSNQTTASWNGGGNWAVAFTAPAETHQVVAALAVVNNAPNGVRVDGIEWRRPVALSFGNQGGLFETDASLARHRLSGVPDQAALYDVSDPARPVRVVISGGGDEVLLDSEGGRRYLVAPDNLSTLYLPNLTRSESTRSSAAPVAVSRLDRVALRSYPSLQRYQPANFNSALNADLLYISHREFLSAVAPLVLERKAQGYDVAVVDVQTIYDGWSGGQISPQAIRSFLRYVAANGSRAPIAATLVGDGTSDPLNYTGRNNTTFIPPYLAVVDPWLGETACESCFAQLDGDDPLSDALMDLMLGRIPVKTSAELDAFIAKLLPYESDLAAAAARTGVLYVTDNYRNPDGTVDRAGDFTVVAEQSIALQPQHLAVERVYYDPVYDPAVVTPEQPWRIADAAVAYQSTLAKWQQGPAFVNYIGHAHHWQWATTDLNTTPPYLLGLYDPDSLRNRADLSIVLGLTCLTSAFQTPAFAGTTIDERILLNPEGGAVAVWGSTGLGVGYGHDALQRGFYTQLWSAAPGEPVGSLVQAGHFDLFSQGLCCQESLRTFALLGDPLTVPMVGTERYRIYAPVVSRD